MPLNANNQRHFMRTLYAGQLQTVTLYKRGDDQKQGTVRTAKLFDCRQGAITKTGEPLQGDMSSAHSCIWHIPRAELDRVGVDYINATDKFKDKHARWWQPESGTLITVKLFEVHVDVQCLRADPPKTA